MLKAIKEKLKDVSDLTEDRIISVADALTDMGYKINSIELAISIPPRASFEIDLIHSHVVQKTKEEILLESGSFFKGIVGLLDKATVLKNKLTFRNKTLSKIILDVSLIPAVKLVFEDKTLEIPLIERS